VSLRNEGYLWKRNITVRYVISFLTGWAFIYDLVLVVYFQHFGLTYTQISILMAIVAGVTLFAEVPTGAFADLHGKKTSIILANMLFALGFILMLISNLYVVFVLAAVFLGLSFAFSSGASQAILYDTLKQLKRQDEYLKVTSRIDSLWMATTILTAFLGPYLFAINPTIPLLISVCASGLAAVASMFLHEHITRKISHSNMREHWTRMLHGFKYVRARSVLKWLVIVDILGAISLIPFGQFLSVPYFLDKGISMQNIAFIETVATTMQTGLLYAVPFIVDFISRRKAWMLSLLGTGILLASTLLTSSIWISMLILGLFWGLASLRITLFETVVTEEANSKNRATIHSIMSCVSSIIIIITYPLIGILVDLTSTATGVFTISTIGIIGGLLLTITQPPITKYRKIKERKTTLQGIDVD